MFAPDPRPASPRRNVHRGDGFSLIEVIVVVGVISLLMAMLLPALRAARESSQRVTCASQLHQLGVCFLLYANANGGSLPAFSGWHTWPQGLPDDTDGPAWTVEMIPYMGPPDGRAYHCPAFPAPYENYWMAAVWSSVNQRSAMKLSDIRMGSRFLLSGDTSNPGLYVPPYGTNGHDTCDYDLSDEATSMLLFPGDGAYLMHRGGNNALFDDLHVEAFRAFDPQRMTYDPTAMRSWQDVHDGVPAAE